MEQNVNLFIIGAAKAGTTSLCYYLNQHPDIFFSPLKEPNFFATDIDPDKFSKSYLKRNQFVDKSYFLKDPLPEWHISFIKSEEQYQLLFKDTHHQKYLAEGSTSYLYSETAAKEINNYNPNAKIIAILRNPIERTYSHYNMALQGGYTDLEFKQAVESDLNRISKGFGVSELFIEFGMYFEQLKRYYDTFSDSRIKIILFDDFKANTIDILGNIFDWLGISQFHVSIDEQRNTGMQPKSKKWNKLLADTGAKRMAASLFSDSIKQKLKSKYYAAGSDELKMEDKQFLLTIFENNIKQTEKLINRDLSNWLRI